MLILPLALSLFHRTMAARRLTDRMRPAMARPLPSTASAPDRPVLFGGFAGATGLSDFPCSCISGVGLSLS